MAHKFVHMRTDSTFPELDNIDVYKYDNDFDYSRYDYTQMELMICTVPWDMGEAHIGNRTISGIGNVVYFESKENRDAWFDAIPDSQCYRFATKFKELHRDHVIDVPIPYDVCAKHNYLKVHYSLFANDDSPVEYEDDTGLRDWFWFIREVEFVAPNTTRLHLLDDAFQTWIYDVDVSGMVLERGHAPMFKTKADLYLSDPLEYNEDLMCEDVNFGAISQVKHMNVLELNSGNMYACIATTANPQGSWGTKSGGDWTCPASSHYTKNGNPSVYVFAVAVADLNTLLANITSNYPQFKQTIQGVFFASEDLITLNAGNSFSFAEVTCYPASSSRQTFELYKLAKGQFGYDERYADLAKLYTSPYAHIEVTDENGNVDVIRVEDTDGTLNVSAMLSLAYPFITLDAHILGVGGNVGVTVTYKNVTSHTFKISGQWYETLRSWKVPTFAVVLDAAHEYDYSTYYDRVQRAVDYNTAYDNASASATTAKSNRDASADTGKTNADASADATAANVATLAAAQKGNADDAADLITDNALLTTTANTAITTTSNASVDRATNATDTYNFDVYDSDNAVIDATATSTIQATEEQANVTMASGAASAAVGTIGAVASLDVGGAISSALNGVIGASSTLASTNIAIHLKSAEAAIAKQSNSYHGDASTDKTLSDATNQKTTASNITTAQNTLTTGQAANASATQKGNATRTQTAENTAAANTQATEKANATRTQTTEKANAQRDYNTSIANAGRDKAQAQSAITNDEAQGAIRSPFIFGAFADGDNSATKPMALFANIVTQNKGAIATAGDEFLRYGYMLDRFWEFDGNWNVGKYFTYWKLRDFWVSNLNVPDMYMDKLRFFLFGGVTVWRRPEDIGKRDIYENFN